MEVTLIPLLLLAAVLVAEASPAPPASASGEFFKEDHLTGSNYLALDVSGKYALIGREHMGVWELERGRWRRTGDVLAFTPEDKETKPYQGTRVNQDGLVFLIWSAEGAAGIVVPHEEVKRDLAKKQGLPPYVFFRITQEVFRRETGMTYPFKFHPEMNRPASPKAMHQHRRITMK